MILASSRNEKYKSELNGHKVCVCMFPLNYVQDRNRDNPAFCYMAASAKLGASSKSLTAFFTA
jgi:hypothetical protein